MEHNTEHKIFILPGEPNDANREYLPEAIKGSTMVVNENGNNSQVYPPGLKEYKGCLADGVEDVWYEYVPASYQPHKKTPLVVSMHGGLMTGWGQAIYTSWTLVADREGFIVVFPNAHKNRMWMIECDPEKVELMIKGMQGVPPLNPPEGSVEEYHDVKAAAALIALMQKKYNIDEGRIFMQGMSMGNAMTSQFARYMGHLLAGAAGSGCPTSLNLLFDKEGNPINRGGAMDIWQSRLEWDKVPPHYGADDHDTVLGNCRYWNLVNGCRGLPKIKIEGENNYAFWSGEKADMVLRDVRNRDHGQTFDDAQWVWDYLFSGTRKEKDGPIVHERPLLEREGDRFAIAAAWGKSKAWVSGRVVDMGAEAVKWQKLKYHGLNGDSIVRGEYLCVPLSFVAEIFQAEYEEQMEGTVVYLKMPDGKTLQFARGCIGCVIDNRVESMLCEALYRNGRLYVSLEWFCTRVCGLRSSSYDQVLYVTDHDAQLSRYMAWLLEDILEDTNRQDKEPEKTQQEGIYGAE